jgi:ribosome-binding protein aMBF1 (putative translation factor)
MTYEKYVEEAIKQTGLTPEQLGRELQIDEKALKMFIEE